LANALDPLFRLSLGVVRFSLTGLDCEVGGDIERLDGVIEGGAYLACGGAIELDGWAGRSGPSLNDGVVSGIVSVSRRGLTELDTVAGILTAEDTGGAVVVYAGGGVSGRSKVEVSKVGGGFSKIDFGILNGFGFEGSAWAWGVSSTTPGFDTNASLKSLLFSVEFDL
jgi:hypothetical protein